MTLISLDSWLQEREGRSQNSTTYYQFQPVSDPEDDRLAKLAADKLWMSDPEKFNDPLDLRLAIKDLTYRGPFDDEGLLKQAISLLLEGNSRAKDHKLYDELLIANLRSWAGNEVCTQDLLSDVERRFKSFGVACFTNHWNNPLMWSHYASQHSGFTVEYSVRSMSLACENPSFSQHHVQYVSQLPELCLSEILFSPHQVLQRMLATKSADWAYEREWRLVHCEQKNSVAPMPSHMEISALIAGLKMEPVKLDQLKATAQKLEIPAFQVRTKYGYQLELEAL